ncbi:MAG: hypothetical protein ACREJC_22775 [Tepidisphaeraceae bacterium]
MATVTPDYVFAVWVADAKARGNQPTVFPSGPSRGLKAERTPTGQYIAPPREVQDVEQAVLAQERRDIAAGERLRLLEDALGAAADWMLSLPRRVVEKVIGWPPWVIPLGLAALAVFLVREWGRRPGSA